MKKKQNRMSPVEIQRTTIKGLMGDNELGEELCLKGGNALALVYGVSERFSQDIDFSMAGDFEDLDAAKERIENALRSEFETSGFEVFDVRLKPRPKKTKDKKWGGYDLTFKVIEAEKKKMLESLEEWSRNAVLVGEKGKVEIDISKYEYTELVGYEVMGDVEVKVLALTAILYEKIRAICQQMPGYAKRAHKTARARDFYDISQILENSDIDFTEPENLKHCRAIFEVKEVPRDFLLEIENQREFHRDDWRAVTDTAAKKLEDFDHYFERVCDLAKNLHSHWDK
jgi:predicted nucleotidyltransferase component of viral defense system